MKEKEIKVETEEMYMSSNPAEKPKKREIKVTAEEQELIFKGIRPENMEQEVFKKVRKDLQRAKKIYSGGQYKHVAVNLNPKLYQVESKGTYVRTEPKRYEKTAK